MTTIYGLIIPVSILIFIGLYLVIASYSSKNQSSALEPGVNEAPTSNKQLFGFLASVLAGTIVLYTLFFYQPQQWQWYAQRASLMQDLASIMNDNGSVDGLKDLQNQEYISLLNDYGWFHPQEAQVWQRLAIGLIALEAHDPALHAIRRFMAVNDDQTELLEARRIEIQLLAEMINTNHEKVSKRQLIAALDSFLIAANEQKNLFYVASVAQQFELNSLAAKAWRRVLDNDQRPDRDLSAKALQGRNLVKKFYQQAQAKAQNQSQSQTQLAQTNPTDDSKLKNPEVQPAAANNQQPVEFSLTAQIKLDQAAQQAVKQYGVSQQLHLWLSLRQVSLNGDSQPGPPIAAKTYAFAGDDMPQEFLLDSKDLILGVPPQIDQRYQINAYLVLSETQLDPLKARQTPYKSMKTITWSNTMSDKTINLTIE